MKCPKCKDRTEVLETAQRGANTHRRRRCLGPHCLHRFTTTETSAPAASIPLPDEGEIRARLLTRELKGQGSGRYDREALAAAISVDRRRAQIRRAQRESERKERAAWYDNGFEPAPLRLDRESLKRELGE